MRSSGLGIPTSVSSSITRERWACPRKVVCNCKTSAICAPTRISGLSAVIGSWKIMPIRPPRTDNICFSGKSRMFCSSNSTLPVKCILCGNKRMIDNAVNDLPEPDSPTNAKISPFAIEKETSSTN